MPIHIKFDKIGKVPVVILPLADYEFMQEDLEMLRSGKLASSIRKARSEVKSGKFLTFAQVKKKIKRGVKWK